MILEDNDTIDESVELLQTNKGIITSKDVLKKLNVPELEISRQLYGDTSKKKDMVIFNVEKKGYFLLKISLPG